MPRTPAVILVCIALLMAGCGTRRAEKEQLLRVVQIREQALNTRNLGLYMGVVSPSYSDKGKDFARLREGLDAGFKMYGHLSYQVDEQKVTINGNRAEVAGKYRMKVVIRGHEMVLDGTEQLTLVKEPDGWKIIAGL